MRFIQVTITIFVVSGRLAALPAATKMDMSSLKPADGIAVPLTKYTSILNSSETIFDLRDTTSSYGISIEHGPDDYEMNMGTIHPFATTWNESGLERRDGSIPLTNYQDIMWIGEISIGTPPKTFKVQIDTGSADMWVLQTGCSGISADRDLWDPKLSISAKKAWWPWGTFQLTYADKTSVTGYQYIDKVTIAGFTADAQIFGSATSYTSRYTVREHADGLLGLAFPSVSEFSASPLFQSLVSQNVIVNPTVSFKLSSSGAEMYIGGTNNMLYKGNIEYTRVTKRGFWQVVMDDIRVNNFQALKNVDVIFDTGASFIFGDWKRVSDLYRPLGGQVLERNGYGFYYLPCESFPTVSLTFGGTTFEILPDMFNVRPITEGSSNCFCAIVARRANTGSWSIGMPFLGSVYTVFNYGTSQVGFAELA